MMQDQGPYPVEAEVRTSWEDPSGVFPINFVSSWWDSLTLPTGFFAKLRWDEPLGRPLLYFLLATIGSAVFELGWRLAGVRSAFTESLLESSAEMTGEGGLAAELLAATTDETTADLLLDFFKEPFIQLIALALTVLAVHLFAVFLASERRSMRATMRVACYAAGPALLTLFPFVGAPIGWIWSVVLMVLGVAAAHRTSAGRATAIVLLPLVGAIMILSALIVVLILLAAAVILPVAG
jgi:hypothetical protein